MEDPSEFPRIENQGKREHASVFPRINKLRIRGYMLQFE
jgi:hypothetical protein